tara:strand:+ start:10445 stop:10600 length:156 start_codon:yes stop_codon:yes gene_type:complete
MTTRQTTLEEWGMKFEPPTLEEAQTGLKPTRQTTIWEWFKNKLLGGKRESD